MNFDLLNFIGCKLLGKPIATQNEGWYWKCPNSKCDSHKFHSLPDKMNHKTGRPYKPRYMCHSCRWNPDEYDLLRERGYHLFVQQQSMIDQWRAEYETQSKTTVTATLTVSHTSSHPVCGSSRGGCGRCPCTGQEPYLSFPADSRMGMGSTDTVSHLFSELSHEQIVFLAKLHTAMTDRGLCAGQLAAYCFEFEEWKRTVNEEHMALCLDPDCDWYCCRASRGDPITEEEIETLLQEVRNDREAERERMAVFRNRFLNRRWR